MATGTNNSGDRWASTSKTIPCSQNLLDILNALTGDVEGASKNSTYKGIIPFTQELVKQIETVGKIKTDKLKDSVQNVKTISTAFKGFSKSLTELTNEIIKGFKDVDSDQFKKISHILISTETAQKDLITKETQNEDGSFTKEYFKIKNPGIIETITAICGLAESLSKVKAPNYIKFKVNFLGTLKMFEYSFKNISKLSESLNQDTIKDIKETTESLQMIMMELPMSVDLMVEMWSKQALQRKLVEWGINTVFGRNYDRKNSDSLGGALGALVEMSKIIKNAELNPKTFESFEKTTKSASVSLFLLTNTLALLVVPGAFAWIGAWILFGRTDKGGKKGGGLLGYVIRGLRTITDNSQDLMKVDKNILLLAATIGMLALVAVAISVAAVLFVATLPALGIIALFMIGVNLMFWFISWVTKRLIIGQGVPKDIFLIAATVGLLALVAVAITILGQYVNETSWDAVKSILLYMGVLTLMFIGVSFVSRIAGQASKDMLWIVASVGLLALIAVGLVYVGKEVETNWESLKAISLMMGMVIAMMISIALASKFIEKGKTSLIILVGCITALCASMYMLGKVAQDTDMNKLWETVGVMGVIVASIVAITWGLGASISGPQALVFLAGVGAIATITAIISGLAATMKEIANVVKLYDESNIDASNVGDITEKLALPILAVIGDGKKNPGIIKYFNGISPKKLRHVRAKTGILNRIVGNIGKMANTLQQIASLSIPIGWDANGNPNKFVKMDSNDFLNASLNSASILHFFTALFDDSQSSWTLDIFDSSITITPLKEDYLKGIKVKTKIKIKRLAEIVGFVSNIADTVQKVASLNIPDPEKGYDENGRPKGYKQMSSTDFVLASINVGLILRTLINGISSPTLTNQLKSLKKRALKNMTMAMDPMKSIGGIVDAIQMLAGGEYVKTWKTDAEGNRVPDQYESFQKLLEDETTIKNNLMKVMYIVVSTMASFSDNNNYKKLLKSAKSSVKGVTNVINNSTKAVKTVVDFYNKDLSKIDTANFHAKFSALSIQTNNLVKDLGAVKISESKAKQLQANIKETSNLLTKINSVDAGKLKYAYSLMSSISKLSQSINGNFQGLAKAINEDLLKALEELQKILNDIQTNGVSTKSSSSSSLLTKGADNVKNGQSTKTDANQTKEPKGNTKNDLSVLQQQLQEIQDLKNTLQALIKNNSIRVIDTSKPLVFGQ